MLKALERRAVAHMKKSIKDPELQRKLTPDYRIGCKRILPSNQWYPALAKPNVNVVTEGIAEIKPEGIVTADGTLHECDVIVHATGFHVTDIPFARRVFGRDGRSLHDVWSGSPQAYKGTAVPGYPNLFFLLGPNTGPRAQLDRLHDRGADRVRDGRAAHDAHATASHALAVRPEAFRYWNDAAPARSCRRRCGTRAAARAGTSTRTA